MTDKEMSDDELLLKSSIIIYRRTDKPHALVVVRGIESAAERFVPCERCQMLIRIDGDVRQNSAGYVLHQDGDESFCQVMGLFCSEKCKREYQEMVAEYERQGRGREFTLQRRSRILDDAVGILYAQEEMRGKE